jgi:hypothetical protein
MRLFSRFPIFLSLFIFFLSPPANGKDKIQAAFERLSVHDYFNARDLFLRSTEKKPAVAWYGLSKISLRHNNPFYSLDSARIYILRSDTAYKLLEKAERESLFKKYGIDSVSMGIQKDSVAGAAYAVATQTNSLETWNAFITDYSYSGLVVSAVSQRNKLAFTAARQLNTSGAYKQFLLSYPSAGQPMKRTSIMKNACFTN